MQTGLAEAWRLRVAGQAAESDERLNAESNLALSRSRPSQWHRYHEAGLAPAAPAGGGSHTRNTAG